MSQSQDQEQKSWSEGYRGTPTSSNQPAAMQKTRKTETEEESVTETQRWLGFLWRVIIICIAAILIGSTAAVILGVFIGLSNITPLITIFTASIALLGGLLAPSPVQEAIRAIADLRSAAESRRRAKESEQRSISLEEELRDARREINRLRTEGMSDERRMVHQFQEETLRRERLEANIKALIAAARAAGNNDVLTPDQLERTLKEIQEKR